MRLRVSLVGLLVSFCLLADDPSAWEIYEKGREAEKAGHMAQAYLYYAQAAAREPTNKTYWAREQAVQSRAALESKPKIPTVAELDKELAQEPDATFDPITPEDLAAAREPLPPTELDGAPERKDIDFTGDFKSLFHDVAEAYGLLATYDSDYQAGQPFRFRLKNVDYRDALYGLEMATGSFVIPLTPKLFMVAKDTPQKRTEVEPTAAISVHLPETFTQQEFTEIVRDVQQTMGIEKIGLDPNSFTVVMRDRISKIYYARALFEELFHSRAQVGLEMQFLEVTRNDMITYGVNLQNAFTATFLSNLLGNVVSIPSGVQGILAFGGGKTLVGIGIQSTTLIGQLSKSTERILLDTELRSLSGQKATIHIGQKYPIITGGYGTSTTVTGQAGVTPAPSFTFQDLGLSLSATPFVHNSQDVSLDIEAQFQVLTGQAVNGLPVISNKSFKNIARLKFGEWAVIGGLMSAHEARTVAGLAGVSRIPFLGPLTSTHEHDTDSDEVLVMLRPTLLTAPANESHHRAFRTGSEARPLLPL